MTEWDMRFREFVVRKESAARRAKLSPFKTVLSEPVDGLIAIGNDWSRVLFDGPFYRSPARLKDLPTTSLVFVQSREGNTVAADPSALGGGDTDKHLIYEGLSRVAADAVMAGAKTMRGGCIIFSTWHPELIALRASLGLPRHPIQIVATLRGLPFEDSLIFNVPELRVVLLTIPSWVALMHAPLAARPWITPVVMDTPNDLTVAFRRLRALGIERISCIGGRTVARQLIDAGLIQDVYLTTSAISGGEPNTPLYPGQLPARLVVRKRGTGADAGVMFEHLAL